MNYYLIVENGKERYLKTKASALVVEALAKCYVEISDRKDLSFQKYLTMNGVDAIYDGTILYINLDTLQGEVRCI